MATGGRVEDIFNARTGSAGETKYEKIMLYVIGLAWIAVMIGIVVAYNRKQQERRAERERQMAAMLADIRANSRVPANASGATTAAAVPAFVKRQRLLSPAMTLHYYVFRTGLPDHEIFTGLVLHDIVDVPATPGGAQREILLRRLARQRLDLVVCNKQLEVVAAILMTTPASGAQNDDMQFASQCLKAAGVRVVSVDPATPPAHTEIRTLIYG